MTEAKNEKSSPKPRRWLRRLAWIGGAAIVLLVALYFVITSGAFVKGVVLPKVGQALNAQLSASSVAFHPFSSIELRNVKLTPKGAETLLTADSIRVRYSLMAIIGGKIAVEELTVASPVITLIENADGTSNLDPLSKSAKVEKPSPAPRSRKPSEPVRADIKSVSLSNATIRQVKHLKGGGQDVLEIANVNLSLENVKNGQSGKLDLSAAVSLANAARTNVPASSLNAKLTSAFTFDLSKDLKPATVKGDASLTVENATGEMTELNGLAANVICDVSPTEIKQVALRFSKAGAPLGEMRASGPFDSARTEGTLTVEILSLDRRALNLVGAASGIDFGSTTINSTNTIQFANGDKFISAAGQLNITRFQIIQQQQTSPTLDLKLDYRVLVDSAAKTAQLNQCRLTLTPTSRAKIELDVTGRMDLSQSSAISGNVKVAAESLDLTSYYDLFAGEQKSADSVAAAPTAASTPPTDPTKEPDPVVLPLTNFVADVSIGRLYLREVDVQKLQATARVDGGHIVLKPLQLTLNGAPVNATADLDLGVPGYKYDVAFKAQSVPLTPLVNSFQPERKGQIGGTLTASAQIKGAGVTGANLQKNLTGKFDVVSTNLNLSLKDVRSPYITPIINIVVGLPDLLRNPVATAGGWLTGAKGGWADKMTAAPIDVVLVNGSAADGHVQVRQAEVRSAAFKAEVTGDVAIAPVLQNSAINFPVTISLTRPLAEQIGQVGANTPTNAAYVALPIFFKETGTLGRPKAKTDALVIAQIATRAGTGIFKGIGSAGAETGGSILNRVEGALGLKPATNGAPGSATNQPLPNLLDLFKKPKTK